MTISALTCGFVLSFQPIENYNEWRLFYFISFLLLVGFFVLNMFVGVVVENFHKCRESQEQEEKARRAAKRAKKLEKKRRSMNQQSDVESKDSSNRSIGVYQQLLSLDAALLVKTTRWASGIDLTQEGTLVQ